MFVVVVAQQVLPYHMEEPGSSIVSMVLELFLSLVVLSYVLKIRAAIVARDSFEDRPIMCQQCNVCCETFWCYQCVLCFLFRHDLVAKTPGSHYSQPVSYTHLTLPTIYSV